jgi:uncharacterized protein (UPF0332 family)
MAKADSVLADASMLADRGSSLSAVNRCYYAMFYAASALAIHNDRDFHKHRAVISWFQREYVKTGRVSPEFGAALQMVFENRCDADYSDVATFTAEQIATMLDQARRFVAGVRSLVMPL